MKYWNIDLTSDNEVMNVSLTRVPGITVKAAEHYALRLMAAPKSWRVVGIDRC